MASKDLEVNFSYRFDKFEEEFIKILAIGD